MLGAQRTTDPRKRNVQALGFETRVRCRACCSLLCGIDDLLNFSFELIDARADLALRWTGSSLQPKIVDLREDAVLAGHPAVTEFFPRVLRSDRVGFLPDSSEQLTHCAVERRGRIVVEFGNAVSQSKFSACYLTTKDTKEHKGASRPIPS